VLVIEWQDPVVQEIGRRDRRLAVVELGKRDLGVGVDKGLLVDPTHALQRANIEGVLGAAVAGAFALELAMRLLVGLGLLERDDLRLGQDEAALRHLGLQRLQPLLHVLQVLALPHAPHPERRDRYVLLPQLIRDPHLAPGRLLDRQLDHRLLDLRRHAVLQDRLLATDLLQGQLATFVIQLLEAIKAVTALPHDLAGLADIAELLGQLQQPDLVADHLLVVGHRGLLSRRRRGGAISPAPATFSPPLSSDSSD